MQFETNQLVWKFFRYAFLETSHVPPKDTKSRSPGGLLHSPQLGSTGVFGTCFMFKYAINGLSSAGLRILLHMGVDEFSIKKERADEIPLENSTTTTTFTGSKPFDSGDERVLWHAQYYILGVWQQAHILYTYPELHSVIKFFFWFYLLYFICFARHFFIVVSFSDNF